MAKEINFYPKKDKYKHEADENCPYKPKIEWHHTTKVIYHNYVGDEDDQLHGVDES